MSYLGIIYIGIMVNIGIIFYAFLIHLFVFYSLEVFARTLYLLKVKELSVRLIEARKNVPWYKQKWIAVFIPFAHLLEYKYIWNIMTDTLSASINSTEELIEYYESLGYGDEV